MTVRMMGTPFDPRGSPSPPAMILVRSLGTIRYSDWPLGPRALFDPAFPVRLLRPPLSLKFVTLFTEHWPFLRAQRPVRPALRSSLLAAQRETLMPVARPNAHAPARGRTIKVVFVLLDAQRNRHILARSAQTVSKRGRQYVYQVWAR